MRVFFVLLVCCSLQASAQINLPVARNIEAAFNKNTRSHNGQPGKNYWQNTATYNLSINFNPTTRLLSGKVDIDYSNQSPDTLNKIVFKLYTDLYKAGVTRSWPVEPADLTKGMSITKIVVDGEQQDAGAALIQGTNMTVPVKLLLPGQNIHFTIEYAYTLNKGSHIRTGEVAEGAYFIAY